MSVEILNKTSVVVNFATFLRDGKELMVKKLMCGLCYFSHTARPKSFLLVRIAPIENSVIVHLLKDFSV